MASNKRHTIFDIPIILSFKTLIMLTEEEYLQVYNKYYRALCMFANSFMNDIEISSDIVSETYLSLWKQKGTYKLITTKYFLYKTVKNKCLNELRHLQSVRMHINIVMYENSSQITERQLIQNGVKSELMRLVYEAIELLPPQRKKVLLLWLCGKDNKGNKISIKEHAISLNISACTFKEHKTKAYSFIRSYLTGKVDV